MKNPALQQKLALKHVIRPFQEVVWGWNHNTLPHSLCLLIGVIAAAGVSTGADHFVFQKVGLGFLYPSNEILYGTYVATLMTSGYLLWAVGKSAAFFRFERKLTKALVSAGLQNRLGKVPKLVSHRPVDAMTNKLRLTLANLPLKEFSSKKDHIEASLGIYIDSIKELRRYRQVDILYAKYPLPRQVEFELQAIQKNKCSFTVGNSWSSKLTANLRETPHFLIAGQTGGGKSTFVRQLVVSLYLKNSAAEFLMVDLKGGLEFQLFNNLKRVEVLPSISGVVAKMEMLNRRLEKRMETLKEAKCKDIDGFNKATRKSNSKRLNRTVIVIDEAAELYLAGDHATASEIRATRKVLSRIARQGRAVGMHLIMATQRPDAQALDSQVKANLPGIVSFPMANLASSMTILGNGRAVDLPAISGRAIYKSGMTMTELQTPFLSLEAAERLLDPHRESEASKADCPTQGPESQQINEPLIDSLEAAIEKL